MPVHVAQPMVQPWLNQRHGWPPPLARMPSSHPLCALPQLHDLKKGERRCANWCKQRECERTSHVIARTSLGDERFGSAAAAELREHAIHRVARGRQDEPAVPKSVAAQRR